jgi:WD40 repeat protein
MLTIRLIGIGAAIAILLVAAGNSGQVGLSQGQPVRTLSGHSESVNSVAFSPDGRLLASGSGDWTIKLWDVATGSEVRTLRGHTGGVNSVAFSPDGRLLASSSGEIKLWDVASGREVRTLSGHTNGVTSVAFSPDGRLLASSSDDKTIKLWDVATGSEVRTLTGHTDHVWSVAFSPDGRLLASGSLDHTIKLWDVASGREVRTLGHKMGVWSMAFSPDGRLLASGSCGRWDRGCVQGEIRLWDVATGSLVRTLLVLSSDSRYNSYWVTSVAFSPNGRLLASGSCIQRGASGLSCIVGDIRLWEVASGREVPTLWQSSHVDVVWSVAFSPDGRLLASGSQDHSIKLWDISNLVGR